MGVHGTVEPGILTDLAAVGELVAHFPNRQTGADGS